MKKLVLLRRFSQTTFLILFIYILWSTTYPLKGILPPETFFKINPLIMIMTSISERVIIPGVFVSVTMLVLTFIFGRFFCGWICPLGSAIDVTGALNRRRNPKSDSANRRIRIFKFFLLGVIIISAVLSRQLAWIFDPMVIMARFVSLNLIPAVTSLLNSLFVILIKDVGLYGVIQDVYRSLKTSILGVHGYYFSHSPTIFAFFLFICLASLVTRRFWCRAVCPLGAIYALIANFAPFKRTVKECGACGKCKRDCRTGAIKDDMTYAQGECILCMDCVYDCPERATRFRWPPFLKNKEARGFTKGGNRPGISRMEFLLLLLSGSIVTGFKFGQKSPGVFANVIRPPGALKEDEFLNRCIRCGNCMKVCITNGLQPVMFQTGLEGIWTPQLVPEIGYCEYQCTLCGKACPTGAIPSIGLTQKRRVRLGLAQIDRSICLPWAQNKECIVCQEHCPVAEKAIKIEVQTYGGVSISKPYVDEALCVGCGICQNKCPVRPVRAIRVSPKNSCRA